jgi:recombination protein RecA
MPKAARDEVSEIIKKFSKEIDIGSIEDVTDHIEGLPTGNLGIDYIVGVGGLPVGRVVESYGAPSSGKTTLALQTAAELQQKIIANGSDDFILYIDFEHALDKKYCKSLGLDLTHPSIKVTQPDSLETGASIARKLLNTGKVKLLIWDSVAEAQVEAVKKAETGDFVPPVKAKIMKQFLEQINDVLYRTKCTAIFINHVQEKITMSGPARGIVSQTTPGGDALKFYSSVRLKFTQGKKNRGKRFSPLINDYEEYPISTEVKVTVEKNKVADPHKSCIVLVRYGRGFDNFWQAVQVLEAHKKITHNGSWFYFDRTPSLLMPGLPEAAGRSGAFQGEDKLLKYGEANPEWRAHIINAAMETVNSAMPGEIEDIEEDESNDIDLGAFVEFS